ncbi:MAG: c-type cytochrome [Bradyrhizobium sp.]|uniref:c-type cytochrome n=1 Tax=Bradyrhizobium sp. TaxID=376 RepID=UPI001C2A0FAD|nr:c-type cytochrome [Bradyrhizobium sp.]MBU6464396.1 c-type cytochrome [Pseudomonadota bacterium]MDE2069440.1 c-type cytochrome [Bradyrhizobium sp.]MDE2244277.1 c-type cytochrome [Bradyrhizobium sp.]
MRQASLALTRLVALLVVVTAFGSGFAFADGDLAKGVKIFERECALCHTIGKGEPNRFGSNLFGITQRKAATAPGYKYSQQFTAMATWIWTPDRVASFVVAPAATIPGNKMSVFQGVADSDLDDLIAYLAAQK